MRKPAVKGKLDGSILENFYLGTIFLPATFSVSQSAIPSTKAAADIKKDTFRHATLQLGRPYNDRDGRWMPLDILGSHWPLTILTTTIVGYWILRKSSID
jgi:hypothetical protein